MTYQIIFSTFVNSTGRSTGQKKLELDLVSIAKQCNVPGFSLANQIGYWAGELERSHVLTLLDTDRVTAFKVAELLKKQYSQDAVIVKPIKETVYFV